MLEREFKGRELSASELNYIIPEKTFTKAIKGVTIDDVQNLKKMAFENISLRSNEERLLAENKRLKEDTKRLAKMCSENNELRRENYSLKGELSGIQKILDENPRLENAFYKVSNEMTKKTIQTDWSLER